MGDAWGSLLSEIFATTQTLLYPGRTCQSCFDKPSQNKQCLTALVYIYIAFIPDPPSRYDEPELSDMEVESEDEHSDMDWESLVGSAAAPLPPTPQQAGMPQVIMLII